jgi:putative flavoprotein involved in K+ transport
LGVLGLWDQQAPSEGAEHVTLAVSGAGGGRTVDFRLVAASGITLVGRTEEFDSGTLRFRNDLAGSIANGDATYLQVLDAADAYVDRNQLDLPEEPEARRLGTLPDCVTDPILEIDLQESGVTSIIWATGYSVDYSWLKADVLDGMGKPRHERGVSPEPGVYFVGLPWLSRRSSSFLCGVWSDASYIAHHISAQRRYLDYVPDTSAARIGVSLT